MSSDLSVTQSKTNPDLIPNSKSVPFVSQKSIDIFSLQKFKAPPILNSFKKKVIDLGKVQTLLVSAIQHSTRDKIVSFLATTLALALIAGAVLGAYYSFRSGHMAGAFGTALIPIATFIIVVFLTWFYDRKWSDDGEGQISQDLEYLYPLVMLTVGPFIPVWRTLRNVS